MTCKDCIHYDSCLEKFRKSKADGFYELIDEEEYFAHADECDFFKDKSRYIELPCKVGDYVHFKGLETPWKVSAIHFYAEGEPQISVTSGKITSTMTFSDFKDSAFVITEKGAK